MKQIYDFGRRTPPGLNEKMLRAELERSKLRLQTTLAVLYLLRKRWIIGLYMRQ